MSALTDTRLATVTAQLEAFNAHDLDAFVATYADECVVVGVDAQPIVGSAALREFYAPRLANPDLSCVIDETVLFGEHFVVAREFVINGTLSTETIATFEVIDGLITRASMVKGAAKEKS